MSLVASFTIICLDGSFSSEQITELGKSILHEHADTLSRIADTLQECDCYRADTKDEDFPCGGCAYCRRAHRQWARLCDDVDDVVPLAVRNINVQDAGLAQSDDHNAVSSWVENISSIQLREAQFKDTTNHLPENCN